MVSFQQDILLTIHKYNETYSQKMEELFTNKQFHENLTLNEAEKIIQYIKEYKTQINCINLTLDKIINVKNTIKLSEKIEKELYIKMLPIITVYRTLLNEKYRVNTIEDQD